MAWRKSPPQLIALFDSVVPRDARVERRQMFGYPAAFAGGRLFAGLHQDSFILKLSEEDRALLQSRHNAPPFEPTPGRRMREYVVLPEELLSDREALDEWLSRSLAYVAATSARKVKPAGTASRRPGGKQRRARTG